MFPSLYPKHTTLISRIHMCLTSALSSLIQTCQDIPGGPVVKISPPTQGVWVQPRVREPHGQNKQNPPKEKQHWDFPGGAVHKNPPVNAGDRGCTSGLGRSHMLGCN